MRLIAKRRHVLLLTGALVASTPSLSHAADAPNPAAQESAPAHGLAVVAIDTASDAAWPLAQGVYARPALRPAALDERSARVLAGEPVGADAAQGLRDLAETRAAIRGDDAPSRQLLASLARTFHVRGLVVVKTAADAAGTASPAARVFLAETGAFDAARYLPDTTESTAWSGAVDSLDRVYGTPLRGGSGSAARPLAASPNVALAPRAPGEGKPKPFYASPWFWGAVGTAAFGGVAVYFATRDNSSGAIHLQMQVPK